VAEPIFFPGKQAVQTLAHVAAIVLRHHRARRTDFDLIGNGGLDPLDCGLVQNAHMTQFLHQLQQADRRGMSAQAHIRQLVMARFFIRSDTHDSLLLSKRRGQHTPPMGAHKAQIKLRCSP
jgi:hypothetical protein